jgi:hypothetical protein
VVPAVPPDVTTNGIVNAVAEVTIWVIGTIGEVKLTNQIALGQGNAQSTLRQKTPHPSSGFYQKTTN